MPRGGKREGAGRKAQGNTLKVSLTLTEAEWVQIQQSGLTVAAFLKRLLHGQAEAPAAKPTGYPRRHAEERWQNYLKNNEQQDATKVIEAAQQSFYNILFPQGAETAQVKTKTQYECPFTGKRFGSMDALAKAAIPYLLKSAGHDLRHKRELAYIRERESSPRYLDQL
ncbi:MULTISPECIES: hypothetical protein [unclassified Paenibacillus]|uniref:hypothetical protein n=1 Tax=unclassified Paenibacillus TaxID=185978 RepID=UPI0006CF61EB|nr:MULTISPECIES: hypothetical protein [unclassified Paenibacillus]